MRAFLFTFLLCIFYPHDITSKSLLSIHRALQNEFDPASTLVSYNARTDCGPNGQWMSADLRQCPHGAHIVKSETGQIEGKTSSEWDIVAIIDNCEYVRYSVFECLSESESNKHPFDPSSTLTYYIDVGVCGPRGGDARADQTQCSYGATAVKIVDGYAPKQPWQSANIVARISNCNYLRYWIYECNPEKVGITTENTFEELPEDSFNLEKGTSNLVKVNFNVQDTQAGTSYAIATDQASATELYFTASAYKDVCGDESSRVSENELEWVEIELSIDDDISTVVANMTNILDVPLVDNVLRFCFVLKMMLKVAIPGATDVLFDGIALTFVLSLSHLQDGEMVIEFITSDASTIDEEVELTSGDEGAISTNHQLILGSPTLFNNEGSYAFGDVIEIRNSIAYTGGNDYFDYTISDPKLYREDKTTLVEANPVNPTSVVEDVDGTLMVIVKLQMPLKVFQLKLEKIVVKYTIAYEEKNPAGRLLSTIDSNVDSSTIESGSSEKEVTVTIKPLTPEDLEAAGIVTDEQMIANGLDPNDYPKNNFSDSGKDDFSEKSSAVTANVAKYFIPAAITTATFLV